MKRVNALADLIAQQLHDEPLFVSRQVGAVNQHARGFMDGDDPLVPVQNREPGVRVARSGFIHITRDIMPPDRRRAWHLAAVRLVVCRVIRVSLFDSYRIE